MKNQFKDALGRVILRSQRVISCEWQACAISDVVQREPVSISMRYQ